MDGWEGSADQVRCLEFDCSFSSAWKKTEPKENDPKETRITVIPPDVDKLVKLGAEVEVESGLGQSINIPDEALQSLTKPEGG